jgi:hypothetical protein
MPTTTMEKAQTGFKKDEVINFALENLKKKRPTETFKKKEIEEQMNQVIEDCMEKVGGRTAKEIAAQLANIYGAVPFHFSFDGDRPFTPEEKQKYNLMGHSDRELRKALNKIRGQQRKEAKIKWDKTRREEVSLFRRYFDWYLKETRGDHKRNKLEVIIGVGDDITYKEGHYKKIY